MAPTPASVLALARAEHELGEPIVPGLDYVRAEVIHAARNEMALTVDDILSRRTRARLLARDASADAADDVAALMAGELDWDAGEQRRQVEHYRALVREEQQAAGLPASRARRTAPRAFVAPSRPGGNSGMETNRGAPTPPIAFPNGAGRATARLTDGFVEVDDELEARLAATGANVTHAAEVVNEASRDWWPLGMIWALDDRVAARASVVVRPDTAEQIAEILRACNDARVPVTAAAGRSGVCGASVPAFGGVLLDLTGLAGIRAVDHTSMLVDVLPGTFGDVFEDQLRAEHGVTSGHWPQSMALSTVGGWLACRGAGQLSTRYGKIEDIVTGLDVVLADGTTVTTGGAPRAAVGPDLTQLFVGSEGTLGIIVGARLRVHPSPAAEGARRVRVHVIRRGAQRRCAASCSAAPHRPYSGSTTRSKPTARTTPATRTCCSSSTKATRTSSMPPCASSPKSAQPPTRSTSRSSSSGWSTATTCPRSRR